MISHFSFINSPLKRKARELQKKLYLKGTSYWPNPTENISIPFAHKTANDSDTIQLLQRLPSIATKTTPVPTVIYITGLDGYHTDTMPLATNFLITHGCTAISVEIPSTCDCLTAANDPTSPDRLWTSVLDWLQDQPWCDRTRILA